MVFGMHRSIYVIGSRFLEKPSALELFKALPVSQLKAIHDERLDPGTGVDSQQKRSPEILRFEKKASTASADIFFLDDCFFLA